jgi:hypothetical protein
VQSSSKSTPEPLPIWFFVGLILLVYGVLVVLASATMDPGHTVLAELRPGLWWGAVMATAGVAFLAIGWRSRDRSAEGDRSDA